MDTEIAPEKAPIDIALDKSQTEAGPTPTQRDSDNVGNPEVDCKRIDAFDWTEAQREPTTFKVKRRLPVRDAKGCTSYQWIEGPADADLYGVVDPAILARKMDIGTSPHKNTKNWYPKSLTIGDFIFDFLAHNQPREDKNGEAFICGTPVGKERNAKGVAHADILIYDCDHGADFMDVARAIAARRLLAVLYPSWSDGSPYTTVRRDAVVEFLKKAGKHTQGQEVTVDHVCDYLREKGYPDALLAGAVIEKTEPGERGTEFSLKHQPMDRFRVVLFLKERFVVGQRPGCDTDAEGIAEYKARFQAVSDMLGLHHDQAATDMSRLMFLPSHDVKKEHQRTMILAGELLDFESKEFVPGSSTTQAAGDNTFAEAARAAGGGDHKKHVTEGLREFAKRFAGVFQARDVLLAMGYEPRAEGRDIECPNENAHGQNPLTGCLAVNATLAKKGSFVLQCQHYSCHDLDRLDLLDLACQRVGITHARELLDRYPLAFQWTDAAPKCGWDEPQPEVKDDAGTAIESDTRDGDELSVPRTIEEGGALFRNLPAVTAPTYRATKDAAFRALARSDFGPSDIAPIAKAHAKKLILEIHEFKAEVNRLRKEMKKEQVGKKRKLTGREAAKFAPLDRHFSILTHSGSVRIMRYPDPGKADISLLRESEFRLAYRHLGYMYGERVSPQGDPIQEQVVDVWFGLEETVRFPGGIVIDPSRTPQESAADGEYNLFAGWDVQPREGGSCQMFFDHLLENVCRGNREYYEWVVMWMAHMLQFPADKQGSAIVLKGKRGIGKTKVGETLCRLIGRRNSITLADRQHLVGRFGAHKMGRVFILVEEAYHPGDKEGEGVIKHLITSHTMPLEKKGVDTIEIDNFAHLMFTSNEDWTVPAGMGDERRFMVLMVGEGRRNDTDFFKAMDHQIMKEGGDEALMHFLLNYVPPKEKRWEDLRNPPVTEWLLGEGEASMSQLHRFFRDMIRERGCAPVRLYTDNGVTKWLHGFHLPGEGMDAIWEAAQAERPLFVLPEGPSAETKDGEPVVRDGKIIGRRFLLPWGLLRPHLEHRWKGSGAIPSDRMIRAAAEEWLAVDPARKDGEGGHPYRMNEKQMGLEQPVQRCLSVPLFDDILDHVEHTKGMTIEPTWDY